ncbi:hypothetical protein PsYK624_150240 [Phanerochaete sordida]|uniref:Uncharacterized protein n=1 Tax=Phanerochaete sordida TaxID=48140 RepID=A0A9P3LKN5_9APHY|nr:hypothetical protein PsYK624_150240 [Phanerochaete sordida]
MLSGYRQSPLQEASQGPPRPPYRSFLHPRAVEERLKGLLCSSDPASSFVPSPTTPHGVLC